MVIQTGKKRKIIRVSPKSVQLRKRQLESQKIIEDLLAKFDTEEKCQDYLLKWKWPEGYRCTHPDPQTNIQCGHTEYYDHKTRHLYECKKCKHQASVTAGTILDKTRTNLRECFQMIIMIVKTLRPLSTQKMKNEFGIESYDKALRMRKKIESALLDNTAYEKLFGIFKPEILHLKKFVMEYYQDKKLEEKSVEIVIRDFRRMGIEMKKHGKKKK